MQRIGPQGLRPAPNLGMGPQGLWPEPNPGIGLRGRWSAPGPWEGKWRSLASGVDSLAEGIFGIQACGLCLVAVGEDGLDQQAVEIS